MSNQLRSLTRLLATLVTGPSGCRWCRRLRRIPSSVGPTPTRSMRPKPDRSRSTSPAPVGKGEDHRHGSSACPAREGRFRGLAPGAWHTVRTKKLSASLTYRFKQLDLRRPALPRSPRHGATHKIRSKARTVSVTARPRRSYPQCGGAFPRIARHRGVDGGRPLTSTPVWFRNRLGRVACLLLEHRQPRAEEVDLLALGQTSPKVWRRLPNSEGVSTTTAERREGSVRASVTAASSAGAAPSGPRHGGSTSRSATPGSPTARHLEALCADKRCS
jgi:hypothetical protein